MLRNILGFVFILKVRALADKYGLSVHMDGARVMNAAVALGVTPSTILQHTHTVSVCLSKVRLLNTNKQVSICSYKKTKVFKSKVRFNLWCVTGLGFPIGNYAGWTPRLYIPGSQVP